KDPGNIFLIPAKAVDGTSAASDATSSASVAAESAVEALPVPGFIESIVDWSMDLLFYKSDGGYTALAAVFQTGMVFAEVLLGLFLIIGLFTAVSSVATVAMGLMIWASGMASAEMLWYIFGGIALIGGSGSTVGLDYY